MADSSRVEELRKRYHENPRRFFAPLANEYRKNGLLDRAILLCQKHLGEQPGNMNGLIVYGQTLFESGRHEEARGPFEAALEVDPENLIALRHLGDIARLGGDHGAAQKWYGRVLEYDRRNDEVRELLDQVGGPVAEPRSGDSQRPARAAEDAPVVATEAASPTPASAPAAPADPAPSLASAKTLEITPRRAPTPPRPAAPAQGQRRASLLDINFDFGEVADAEPTSGPVPSAPVLGAEAAEYGFSATTDLPLLDPVGTGESERPSDPVAMPASEDVAQGQGLAGLEEPLAIDDQPVEDGSLMSHEPPSGALIDLPPEPVSLGSVEHVAGLETSEFETHGGVEPLADLVNDEYDAEVSPLAGLESAEFDAHDPAGSGIAPLAELEPAEFHVPASDEPLLADEPPIADEPSPSDDPLLSDLPLIGEVEAASAPTPSVPTPVVPTPATIPMATPGSMPAIVTETMAELYLEQGHRAQAIEVYRKLLAMDPGDAQLQGKLDALLQPERISLEFDALDDMGGDTEAGPVEHPPANAMLNEVSFADVALDTPSAGEASAAAAPAPAAPIPEAAISSGPSAREFFAAFAARTLEGGAASASGHDAVPAAPTASSSWAFPPAMSSLDDLFGTEVPDDDQRAANFLAGIGTTAAPSGTSTFDALFASAESPPPQRTSVPRASQKLRFDEFFSASSSAAAAPPAAEPPSAEPSTQDAEPGSAPTGGDDDLDQFQGWLKGLTQ